VSLFLLSPKAVNCLGYHSKSEQKSPNAVPGLISTGRQNLYTGNIFLSNSEKYREFYMKMARGFFNSVQIAVK
jgi:hypothetical protein